MKNIFTPIQQFVFLASLEVVLFAGYFFSANEQRGFVILIAGYAISLLLHLSVGFNHIDQKEFDLSSKILSDSTNIIALLWGTLIISFFNKFNLDWSSLLLIILLPFIGLIYFRTKDIVYKKVLLWWGKLILGFIVGLLLVVLISRLGLSLYGEFPYLVLVIFANFLLAHIVTTFLLDRGRKKYLGVINPSSKE
jgi:hypothetical protein